MSPDSNGQEIPYRPERLKAVDTGDGSRTLYDPERDAHFSSLHGARTESRHIFLQGTGLLERERDWHVLELGFGAGINFRQTARAFAESAAARLVYHAVDYAPVRPEDVPFESGPYSRAVGTILERIPPDQRDPAPARWSDDSVQLILHPIRWCDLDLESFRADAVFFDPFDPKREPDSWTVECFRVAREHMEKRGVLGTYSAASDVKRAMFEAGLSVASAPGPGPKREITYAARSQSPLEALPSAELLRRSRYVDGTDG